MLTAIDEGLRTWEKAPAQPFDLVQSMNQLTMRVIVKGLFGGSLTTDQMNSVAGNMGFVLTRILQGAVTQALPAWLPVPGRQRYCMPVGLRNMR